MEQAYDQVIDRTLKVWQPRSSSNITREDARQIAENFVGFFQLLLQWDADNSSADIVNATAGILRPVETPRKGRTTL